MTNGAARSIAAGAGDDVVTAEHLTKRFGDVLAVDDLSFTLKHGTVTGFLGPNAARRNALQIALFRLGR
jgi:ABC-type Na+ transport system ATPase subunit NatA